MRNFMISADHIKIVLAVELEWGRQMYTEFSVETSWRAATSKIKRVEE
jgi:hypothetical protein